jgi:hypothetical protein
MVNGTAIMLNSSTNPNLNHFITLNLSNLFHIKREIICKSNPHDHHLLNSLEIQQAQVGHRLMSIRRRIKVEGVVSGGRLFLSTYGRANVAKIHGMEINRDPKFRIENGVRIYPLILQESNFDQDLNISGNEGENGYK